MERTISSQGPQALPAPSSTEPAAGQLPGTRHSGCPSSPHHGARRRRALSGGQDPTDQKEKQQSAGAVQSLTKSSSGTNHRLWHGAHAPAPALPAWLWAPRLRRAGAAHAPRIAPTPTASGHTDMAGDPLAPADNPVLLLSQVFGSPHPQLGGFCIPPAIKAPSPHHDNICF